MTTFVAHFSTSGKISVVEDWLGEITRGKWSMQIEDISADLHKKTYKIVFQDRADYMKFRERFAPGQPSKHPV